VTLTSSLVITRTTRKASLLESVKVIDPAGRQRASTSRRARVRIYPRKARSPRRWEAVCKQSFTTSQHRRVESSSCDQPAIASLDGEHGCRERVSTRCAPSSTLVCGCRRPIVKAQDPWDAISHEPSAQLSSTRGKARASERVCLPVPHRQA